jgi:DNA-binding HxlR family transcriptional regulator
VSRSASADEAESEGNNSRRPPARHAWPALARALQATGDPWTLAIVLALAPGRTRLTNLRERLPGISTGVLARGLAQMVELGLVKRTRYKEKPPRVELELTDAGRELMPIAEALAHWGERRGWSEPRDLEQPLDLLPGSPTTVCHNGGRGGQRRDPQGP